MEQKSLWHSGVLGMHWGHRRAMARTGVTSVRGKPTQAMASVHGKAVPIGPNHRKTGFSLTKNLDGRKVNKLFGAVNRKKVRNYLLGDPDKFIKNFPGMDRKFSSLSKDEKVKMHKRVSNILATISVVSMGVLYATFKATH